MIGALSSTSFACRVARRLCMLANAQLMFKFSNGKPEPPTCLVTKTTAGRAARGAAVSCSRVRTVLVH